jgi:hypothetical protein
MQTVEAKARMHQPLSKTVRVPRRNPWFRALLAIIAFVLYLTSTVPVGMTLYAIKSEMGWDVFKRGGFHTLASCLREAARP